MHEKKHWEGIYSTKSVTEVSWFQEHSDVSLEMIGRTGIPKSGEIIDVGGGASRLVDDLIASGYQNLTVLDISASALSVAKRRLGTNADAANWLEGDITSVVLPHQKFDLWHDRAVFHFLTDESDRTRYVQAVRDSVRTGGHIIVAAFGPDGPLKCSGLPVVRYSPFLTDESDRTRYVQAVRDSVRTGGHIIVAAFGPDGPLKCSGLPVVRYSPDGLHDAFGASFELVEHASEDHRTPFGTVQPFVYCYCRVS